MKFKEPSPFPIQQESLSEQGIHYQEIVTRIEHKLHNIYQLPEDDFLEKQKSMTSLLENLAQSELLQEYFSLDEFNMMIQQLQLGYKPDDEQVYIDSVLEVLEPLLLFQVGNPILYEDIQAETQIKMSGWHQLNRRVAYGLGINREGKHVAHIHFSASHELKKMYRNKTEWVQAVKELYEDGLRKLAVIAHDDPQFAYVGSTSWLNATNTYGTMKREMGFVGFEPISDEIRAAHFSGDGREILRCILPRDILLENYYRDSEVSN